MLGDGTVSREETRLSLENSGSSRKYGGVLDALNRNAYPQAFQSFEQVALHVIGMATVQEIGSQLPIGLIVFQHVIHTHGFVAEIVTETICRYS